jgi:type IV secretory pathway TraG/TraD family ATPase VirD4
MEPETIAAALVPDDSKERFFSEAAKSLLADLYERCRSNQEVWEVISTFSMKEIEDFLSGSVSARYFGGENTGSSVLSTLVNEMRFYRRLVDDDGFSFSRWGREDDPRWLFCTVFEDDAELFKPLYSMAFELMLKGLLSHPDPEGRRMKTAIVVDELGALNRYPGCCRRHESLGGRRFWGRRRRPRSIGIMGNSIGG